MKTPSHKKPIDGYKRSHHILSSASNLLGICFVLITGLTVTDQKEKTYADEISFLASFFLLGSCLFSYLSIRVESPKFNYEGWADVIFIAAMCLLFVAMLLLMIGR